MLEGEVARMQIEGAMGKCRLKVPVVGLIAMGRVADDGVPQMPQVEPYLMVPAGFRSAIHERKTARRVPGYRDVPFVSRQRRKMGAGLFRLAAVTGGQGFGYLTNVIHPPPDNGQVPLLDGVVRELSMEHAVSLQVLCKEHEPAGRPVDAVYGMHRMVDDTF